MNDTQAPPGHRDMMARLQDLYEGSRGPGRTLRGDDRLADDLGIDSLQLMEMLAILEEQLGIEIVGDPGLFNITTVDDLVELLAHRVAGDKPRSKD
ncbi:MAG TPA: acyl carrier protein [Thermoleophilaceae bacterium]|jgi:acyl carrier protein